MTRMIASAVWIGLLALGAQAQTLRYRGTIGQQTVTITLDVQGDDIRSAVYRYASAKADVEMVEHRVYGTTAVLADDDGNVFHLHLQNKTGEGVKDFASADQLAGTMDRGEIDLPVAMTRLPATP